MSSGAAESYGLGPLYVLPTAVWPECALRNRVRMTGPSQHSRSRAKAAKRLVELSVLLGTWPASGNFRSAHTSSRPPKTNW